MLAQMNAQAVTTLQQSAPCVSPDFWQNYMDANQTQLFIGRMVPVYQRHFTSDELEGLLKFYRSPLGQKVINEMPATMAEALRTKPSSGSPARARAIWRQRMR